MRAPAVGTKINFHIAGRRRLVADLNDCSAKVGSALQIAEPGMKHANNLTVQRLEVRTLEALMLPDGLKQSLGRQIGRVPETARWQMAKTPLRIKAVGGEGHLGLLLRWCFRKVKLHGEEFLIETKAVLSV